MNRLLNRVFRLLKRRRGLSITDRKFHTEDLKEILGDEVFNSIEKAYKLSYTEANEKNLKDIFYFIKTNSLIRLCNMYKRMPDSGFYWETVDVNFYEIYLLIDKKNESYVVVIYTQIIGDYEEKLITNSKIKLPFYHHWCNKQKVYPV
ncbi:MAG: hypothetical protein RIQ33_25 [Bacteroidota bacterium]